MTTAPSSRAGAAARSRRAPSRGSRSTAASTRSVGLHVVVAPGSTPLSEDHSLVTASLPMPRGDRVLVTGVDGRRVRKSALGLDEDGRDTIFAEVDGRTCPVEVEHGSLAVCCCPQTIVPGGHHGDAAACRGRPRRARARGAGERRAGEARPRRLGHPGVLGRELRAGRAVARRRGIGGERFGSHLPRRHRAGPDVVPDGGPRPSNGPGLRRARRLVILLFPSLVYLCASVPRKKRGIDDSDVGGGGMGEGRH